MQGKRELSSLCFRCRLPNETLCRRVYCWIQMRDLPLSHIVRMNSMILSCLIPNCIRFKLTVILVTTLRCWLYCYVWFKMLVSELLYRWFFSLHWCLFQCYKSVTNILNFSQTHSVTNNGITQLIFHVEGSLCIFYRGTKITYFKG